MSYVEKNLMPGEQIEYRANLHWLVFILPTLLFIAAIWLFFSLGGTIAKFLALILIVGVLVTGLHAVIERMTSEFAVTNKRVLIKTGLIRRHSLETLLGQDRKHRGCSEHSRSHTGFRNNRHQRYGWFQRTVS